MTIAPGPPMPLEAEADGLCLRALTEGDAPALVSITDDPAITGAISFLPERFGPEDARAMIAGRDPWLHGIFVEGQALAGIVGLHLRSGSAERPAKVEIGYWIGTAFQGRGLATAALRLALEALERAYPGIRVIAACRPDNLGSRRVLERCGFAVAGPAHRPGMDLFVRAPARSPS